MAFLSILFWQKGDDPAVSGINEAFHIQGV